MQRANGRLWFDGEGHLNSSGPVSVSQLLGALRDQMRLFLSAVEACDKVDNEYVLTDVHGRAGAIRVLWDNAVAVALAMVAQTIPGMTNEETATFKSTGIVTRFVAPARNLKPIACLAWQIVYSIPYGSNGEWVNTIPVTTVQRLRALATHLEEQLHAWERSGRLQEPQPIMTEIKVAASITSEQVARQLRSIADRLITIGTAGTPSDRWREHHVQLHHAGWLLFTAIDQGWLTVPDDYRAWVREQTQIEHEAAAKRPPVLDIPFLDGFCRLFNNYTDRFLLLKGNPLIRPEKGGLSSFNNIRMNAEESAALVGGRLQTAADACMWIADHLADPMSSQKTKSRMRRKSRKRPLILKEPELTPLEIHTLGVVGRHRRNFAAAAAELHRNPKTVRENYERALAKSSRIGGRKSRNAGASKLPTDERGQENPRTSGG